MIKKTSHQGMVFGEFLVLQRVSILSLCLEHGNLFLANVLNRVWFRILTFINALNGVSKIGLNFFLIFFVLLGITVHSEVQHEALGL